MRIRKTVSRSKYAKAPDIGTISLVCSRSKNKMANISKELKTTKNYRAELVKKKNTRTEKYNSPN